MTAPFLADFAIEKIFKQGVDVLCNTLKCEKLNVDYEENKCDVDYEENKCVRYASFRHEFKVLLVMSSMLINRQYV